MSGDALVFIHRRRIPRKIRLGDRNGWGLFYKRLESGPFERPKGRAPSWAEMERRLDGMARSSVRDRWR